MKQALIQVRPDSQTVFDDNIARAMKAMETGVSADPVAVFTFSSPAQMFTVISPKRWELIEHLQGLGPSSVRGLARSLDRDIRRVHDDITVLVEWGIIEKNDDGKIYVPYDLIHADFNLRAVA